MPQLTRQLRVLGIGTVTQQRLNVGAICIRVGRRGHERAVQVDVDMTEQRTQPVIHWSHGVGQVEIVPVGLCHLRLHVQHRVGEIQVIVARSGYEEFYRSTRVQRGHGLMFHYVAVDDAVLSGGYGKEIQFGLDPFARLSILRKPSSLSNMSASRFVDVCLLRRLVAEVTLFFAGARFIRLRARTPGAKKPRIRFLQASATRRLVAFLCSVRTCRRRLCARRSSTSPFPTPRHLS